MILEWEEVYNNSDERHDLHFECTHRAKVIGGWLIKHSICYLNTDDDENDINLTEGWKRREISMVFLPDPYHDWGLSIHDLVE